MGAGLTQCVRYLLFFFNLIFALAGLGLLVLGGLAEYYMIQYQVNNHVEMSFHYIFIALIAVGGVITIIAFFGCCGSVKESHCMLYTFGVFLVTLFVLEIAAGIAAYVMRDQIAGEIEKLFDSMVHEYHTNGDYQKVMDGIQMDLHCCGSRGPGDYASNQVPLTCCPYFTDRRECQVTEAFTNGCYNTIFDFVQNLSIILLAVGGGVAVVQLIGIIFSFCLANSIRRGYEIV